MSDVRKVKIERMVSVRETEVNFKYVICDPCGRFGGCKISHIVGQLLSRYFPDLEQDDIEETLKRFVYNEHGWIEFSVPRGKDFKKKVRRMHKHIINGIFLALDALREMDENKEKDDWISLDFKYEVEL